jgi:LysR family transcriptional regulator for metE and metH
MIERSHLAILDEIDRNGSLTAAAERLCVTQSALSHAIRKLEQQLGTPLWTRDGRKFRLTAAGRYLLAQARRILPQFEHTEMVIRQIAEGRRGTLRIGIECHPCYEWLLSLVAPYLRQWPDVDVDVKQQHQFNGIGALFNHEIEILVTPDPLQKSMLRFIPVFDYEAVAVVADEHRLAEHRYIEPEDLADETLITYPVELQRLDVFSRFLLPAGVMPRRHMTIETMEIMLQMVVANRGVAALPRWMVERHAANLPLRAIRLGRKGINKQIHLGLRKEDEAIDYIRAFVKLAEGR